MQNTSNDRTDTAPAPTTPAADDLADAMTIKEFCEKARIGRTTTYRLIRSGRLKVRKMGKKKVLILARDYRAFIESLPAVPARESKAA